MVTLVVVGAFLSNKLGNVTLYYTNIVNFLVMTNSLITQHHFYMRKEKLNLMFNVNKTALNRLLTTFLSLPI